MRPLAVAAGGGFNDEMFAEMKDACKSMEDGIVWLRADVSKVGTMPSLSDPDAYGLETAVRIKRKLKELGVDGEKGGEKNGGVHFFT